MSSCLDRHEDCDGDVYDGGETDTESDSRHRSKWNTTCTCGLAIPAREQGVCQGCER